MHKDTVAMHDTLLEWDDRVRDRDFLRQAKGWVKHDTHLARGASLPPPPRARAGTVATGVLRDIPNQR